MLALKNLSRYRLSISDICADLKKSTVALLDQVFPEYVTVFNDIFGATSKKYLKNTPPRMNFLKYPQPNSLTLFIKSAAVETVEKKPNSLNL